MTKKMILDLDTGIDDALALAYAAASPEVELIGITGTYGNVQMALGVENSIALLDLLDLKDVPVFKGLPHAKTKDSFEVQEISAFIHGKNGLGEIELPRSEREAADQSAVYFIVESARKYGQDLYIVPVGPMTNIAAAIEKDPEAMKNVGKVVLMGGALTVPGNVNEFSEANISQDPESADELFRADLPVTMVGLDVTTRTLLTYEETQKWRDLGTESGKFFADMTDYYIKAYETTSPHLGGCALHDPLAVAAAIQPDFLQTLHLNMKVDTEGAGRGRTIGDETRINEADPIVQVGVNVAVDEFVDEFMTRLTALFKKH